MTTTSENRNGFDSNAAEPAVGGKTSSEWREYGSFLLKLALFVFILRSLIVSPFNIPSESMQPRLLIGDYLLVAKWPYGYSEHSISLPNRVIRWFSTIGVDAKDISDPSKSGFRIFASQPARGDVVVFKAPPTLRDDYIKRVIGLPGDVIQMRNGVLEINGVAVRKERIADFIIPVTDNMKDAAALEGTPFPCYKPNFEERAISGGSQCRYPRYIETLPGGRSYEILDLEEGRPGDDTQAFLVGEDEVFLMGDNRDRSADSRFPADGKAIGIVPQKYLVGRALVSVFSTDGSARWLLPWTWFSAARFDRIGQGF